MKICCPSFVRAWIESSPCTAPSLVVEDIVYVCRAMEYFCTLSTNGMIQCKPGVNAISRYPFGANAEITTPYSLAFRENRPPPTQGKKNMVATKTNTTEEK